MLILGIDEAGRGPVLGPMVMCGYLINDSNIDKLRAIGVKDSKLLTEKRREEIFEKVKGMAENFTISKIDASEIDSLRTKTNLNKIEIDEMKKMIELLKPDKVIIDAPEVNLEKFKIKIEHNLKHKAEIVCENFADKNHLEVGAASIIAKVTRDEEIKKLHKKYGFFGSGYTSDDRTIKFLKDWIKVNKEYPPIVRRSWVTASEIKKEKEQKTLMNYGRRN